MRFAIANYRNAKKLLRVWEAHTQHLIELNAPHRSPFDRRPRGNYLEMPFAMCGT